jgi:hypothetical protein
MSCMPWLCRQQLPLAMRYEGSLRFAVRCCSRCCNSAGFTVVGAQRSSMVSGCWMHATHCAMLHMWYVVGCGRHCMYHHPCGSVNSHRAPTPGLGCHTSCLAIILPTPVPPTALSPLPGSLAVCHCTRVVSRCHGRGGRDTNPNNALTPCLNRRQYVSAVRGSKDEPACPHLISMQSSADTLNVCSNVMLPLTPVLLSLL